MKTTHKIIIGDSRSMREVPDEHIHLIVTSPPYWQLKDYGYRDQIGFDDTYEEYVNNLNLVWSECHRVLHKGCRLCINIGDQFARSAYYGRYKIIPIRTEIIKFCEVIGFDYMGAVIWRKVTTCNTTGGATIMGSFPYPRSGILKLDYEFILIFKKRGSGPKVSQAVKERSKLTPEEWKEYFSGHWHFSGEKQDKHLAMFPVELPKRLIRMFSFVGDTVLDPFLGSGTTTLASCMLERNSVGYEINHGFLTAIEEKIGFKDESGRQDLTFEVIEQERSGIDLERARRKLPYVFEDAAKLDRKVDPKTSTFGSRIDATSRTREKYYRVKKVVSPEIIVLHDGKSVRLLGIRTRRGTKRKAMEFLREKTLGEKIFLRLDAAARADGGSLPCYVYLANRTFLNAHLIKKGLADADKQRVYDKKQKFLALRDKSP